MPAKPTWKPNTIINGKLYFCYLTRKTLHACNEALLDCFNAGELSEGEGWQQARNGTGWSVWLLAE